VEVSTLDDSGSDTGSLAPDSGGSVTGIGGAGLTLFARATFLFAAFFLTVFFAGTNFAFAFFWTDGLATFFFATFLALLEVFALLDDLAGRVFFLVTLLLGTLLLVALLFTFVTGRLALLFFFAMINPLLAVLRLLTLRVAPKKSAVICP
jgi:hypothetical protein